MNAVLNHTFQPRSNPLEHLDTILDDLTGKLDEAVASAVARSLDGNLRDTVLEVLTELLASPDVLAQFHQAGCVEPIPSALPAEPLPSARKPGLLARCRGGLGRLCSAALYPVRRLADRLRPWGRPLTAATLHAVTMGVIAYLVGPSLGACLCGLLAFSLALTLHLRLS